MKGALFAALQKSPWLFAVLALAALFALWLVMTHSYAFSLHAKDWQLELSPPTPGAHPVTEVATRGGS